MIVVDTNVVSEPVRQQPSASVMKWLAETDNRDCYLAAVVLAELLSGLAVLPPGRKKAQRHAELDALLHELFGNRVLAFDKRAAEAYADLTARAARNGQPVSVPDGQIGAIAAVHGFTVATRDSAPFRAMGLPIIDPWQHPA